MKSIAIFNNKGGVGKTTFICNFGAFLSLRMNKKVLIIDADPQCNTTLNMLKDDEFNSFYEKKSTFTIYNLLQPIYMGKKVEHEYKTVKIEEFGINLLIGDPRLALMEDLLSSDWKDTLSGTPRGFETSIIFKRLQDRFSNYDYILFDTGPSLGAINRSILLTCDYFLSPMSADIFSLLAIENIGQIIQKWKKQLNNAFIQNEILDETYRLQDFWKIKFLGYIVQQYTSKKNEPVKAYERIIKKIPKTVKVNFAEKINKDEIEINYNLGTIPNFNSIIPLSQTAHKPIIELQAKDGVVGAHFSKVKEFEEIITNISENIVRNIEALS